MRQQDLPSAALVDHDSRRLYSNGDEVPDDFRNDFGHRRRSRGAGAVDLDTDEILRIEEARPTVARIFVAGQSRHSPRDHGLDSGNIDLLSLFLDALGGM